MVLSGKGVKLCPEWHWSAPLKGPVLEWAVLAPERSDLCTSVKSQGLLGFGEKLMLKMIFFPWSLNWRNCMESSVSDGWIVLTPTVWSRGLPGSNRFFMYSSMNNFTHCVCPSVLFTDLPTVLAVLGLCCDRPSSPELRFHHLQRGKRSITSSDLFFHLPNIITFREGKG